MTTGLVGQHQLAPFASPQPGQPLDATVVLGNDNSTVNTYDAHDNDSTIHFQSSALADRPPASTLGQKWLTTDANARFIYYDNGSAWVEVDYFRDTGGIITGAVTISDTTESTSTTTGALIVSGGVGIAKNVFIGGTLGVTGVATFTAQPIVSTLTASLPVFSDGSKGLVSNAMTGTGNVVMSASPTLTGTIGAASMTLSGTLGVTGVATLTAQPILSSLTASKPVFTDASKGLVSTGTLGTDQGGTNLTSYTTGDILYASATNVLSKLPIGTTGQHLIVSGGIPSWSTDSALGTVTSVSWTGGLVSVATATTTPALTVAGTSGGIVYFSSASTWASSAALTQYGVVYGGGAGATPVATAAGTTGQVLTATTSGAPTWSATYAGTVTSVGFTGGLISVATATTTPALTVAGTSGGVVYFSSASTWASSAALTANAIVLGGGAGAAPATTTTGTGVVTALGVNVGTAGAFVVNGGALGTPSSGAVAASLITAGTFGAGAYTFPGALAITGAFTGATSLTASANVNLASSSVIEFGASSGVQVYRNTNDLNLAVATGGAIGFRVNGALGPYYDGTTLNFNSKSLTGATTGAFSDTVTSLTQFIAQGDASSFRLKNTAGTSGAYFTNVNNWTGAGSTTDVAVVAVQTGGAIKFYVNNATVQASLSASAFSVTPAATFSSTLGVTGAARFYSPATLQCNAVGTRKDTSLNFDAANGGVLTYGTIGLQISSASAGSEVGGLTFWTINNSSLTEKMFISGAGNVGIGTTTPSYKLEISTDSAGKPGVGGLWTVVSDARIKTDIVPADLNRCYEIVKSVPLKHFGFASGVYTDDQIQDKHNLGWIAQDVQKVFRNAVSARPFTLKTDIPDGIETYEEQDFTLETVEKTETSIQVIDGKPVQVSKVVTSENKVLLFDTVDVLDEAGNAVIEGDKPLTYQMPRMITKTRPKVRHDVIEDCLDLNGGQMIAALYGAVQAIMDKGDALTARVAALEAV